MTAFLHDIGVGVQRARRTPREFVAIAVILSFAAGTTAAAVAFVSAILLRPLTYRDGGRIVRLWDTSRLSTQRTLSSSQFDRIVAHSVGLHEVSLFAELHHTAASATGERVRLLASPQLLALPGTPPLEGARPPDTGRLSKRRSRSHRHQRTTRANRGRREDAQRAPRARWRVTRRRRHHASDVRVPRRWDVVMGPMAQTDARTVWYTPSSAGTESVTSALMKMMPRPSDPQDTLTRTRDKGIFAHSLPTGPGTAGWESLAAHHRNVGQRTANFAAVFLAHMLGLVAGLLHDIGKTSADFQDHIRGVRLMGPDHSTAGARLAATLYGWQGRLLAFVIAGHHSGLMDGSGTHGKGRSLSERLDATQYTIPAYDNWQDHTSELPARSDLRPDKPLSIHPDYPGFETAFLIRMLFSCLVDADFLETERFYAAAGGEAPPARGGTITQAHLDRIRLYMAGRRLDDTPINCLRAEILDHAVGKAALAPGLFTLTVPTGGGKTLASLTFALEHALTHGLRRVVYVIPFTSIIEQTAQVFREALSSDADILEHHASFDWDRHKPASETSNDAEGADMLAKLRRDAENWDAPIVVTTAVQFFESLFAAQTSRARKLHNLAKSVIVLDEAQILPVRLLRPCMAALDELARNYGATVVLCTATQPAWRKQDAALPSPRGQNTTPGFDIGADRELAPRPRALYDELKRVSVEWRREPVTDAEICARFIAQPQMLCIVNSREHARELFEQIAHLEGARHLTTLMYARHRRDVLAQVKTDLADSRPVRLVATSLIEAGVDISFPEVWRAATGLDSIAQAAGRCNREGKLPEGGRLVIFEPASRKIPPEIDAFYQAAREVLRSDLDPLGLDAIQEYFRELYFEQEYEALDAARLGDERYPILPAIRDTCRSLTIPFSRIAQAFRLIDDVMVPVMIPREPEAQKLLDALEHAPFPPADALRKLQQYVVPVPRKVREDLLASGAAQAINAEVYGDRFIYLASLSLYAETHGLKLDDPTWRASEENVL